MNTGEIDRITRRPRGKWRVSTACLLMAFDVFVVPPWVILIGSEVMGSHGPIEIAGQVVPLWFVFVRGVLAMLSVVGLAAIALQTNALGFRVVTAVAVAWVAFAAVAWLAGNWDVWAFAYRASILGLLFWGRGTFNAGSGRDRVRTVTSEARGR